MTSLSSIFQTNVANTTSSPAPTLASNTQPQSTTTSSSTSSSTTAAQQQQPTTGSPPAATGSGQQQQPPVNTQTQAGQATAASNQASPPAQSNQQNGGAVGDSDGADGENSDDQGPIGDMETMKRYQAILDQLNSGEQTVEVRVVRESIENSLNALKERISIDDQAFQTLQQEYMSEMISPDAAPESIKQVEEVFEHIKENPVAYHMTTMLFAPMMMKMKNYKKAYEERNSGGGGGTPASSTPVASGGQESDEKNLSEAQAVPSKKRKSNIARILGRRIPATTFSVPYGKQTGQTNVSKRTRRVPIGESGLTRERGIFD